jgi:peptidoglycan/LPS O-acetylase OafA/YrhL
MSWFDVALERFVSLGFYGVHLFFMISGFILAVPFCRHALDGGRPVNLRAYFWRRITRLEPPYVLTMLVFFALMPLAKDFTWAQLWPHLLASLGYVHNIVYGQGSLINNNAWTLEIEVQFYLLMPLLALALRLPALPRRALFVAMAVGLSLHGLWLPRSTPQSVLQYGQYFLVGILLCDLWTMDWRGRPRTWAADAPGILAWPIFVAGNLGVGALLLRTPRNRPRPGAVVGIRADRRRHVLLDLPAARPRARGHGPRPAPGDAVAREFHGGLRRRAHGLLAGGRRRECRVLPVGRETVHGP